MKRHFQRLIAFRIVRYILVGGSAYVIEMAALTYLRYILDWSPRMSIAVSFWIGFVVALVLQKLVTFQNYETHHKAILRQTLMYAGLVAWNYGFTLTVTSLLEDHTPVVIIRTTTIAVITLWNFAIYQRYIFKESDAKEVES
jgi:putative flippase GtrA